MVLLLTLSFIAVVSIILAAYFNLTDAAIKRTNKEQFLVQTAVFTKNIRTQILPFLNGVVNSIASFMGTDDQNASKQKIFDEYIYNMPIPISTKGFRATLLCKPANTKININRYKDLNESARFEFEQRWYNYLQQKNVPDAMTLFDILRYVLGMGEENEYTQKQQDVNIFHFVHNFNPKDKLVLNSLAWEKIIDEFEALTGQKKIRLIAWDSLIGFEGKKIYYNHISKELCEFVFSNSLPISPNLCDGKIKTQKDVEAMLTEDDLSFAKVLNIDYGFNPDLACEINFNALKESALIRFFYALSSNKMSDLRVLIN